MNHTRRRLLVILLFVSVSASLALLARSGHGARTHRTGDSHRKGSATAGAPASGRTPAEEAAVQRALRGRLRAAEDGDAEETDERSGMESLYAAYHPYFVRGDLNGDGRLDFAQAFVRLGGGEVWFDVGVFFGAEDGRFTEPIFVERGLRLENGDLSVDRTLLVVTPDLGFDELRRWRFDASLRRFVDADAESNVESEDDEIPDESPDSRPRIRV